MSTVIDQTAPDGAVQTSTVAVQDIEAVDLLPGKIASAAAASHATEPIHGPANSPNGPTAGAATGKIARDAAALAADAELRKLTMDMLSEGVLDALGAALQGASAEEVKALYNRTGRARMVDLAIEPFEVAHPTLGTVSTARFTGRMEDGSAIEINDAFNQSLQLYCTAKRLGLDPRERLSANVGDISRRRCLVTLVPAPTNRECSRWLRADRGACPSHPD